MRLVILESPFAGDTPEKREENIAYARAALRDSLMRCESPLASHLLYTQALDDTKAGERMMGINAGCAWYQHADAAVVYTDFGISPGMELGIARAKALGIDVEHRSLEGWPRGKA